MRSPFRVPHLAFFCEVVVTVLTPLLCPLESFAAEVTPAQWLESQTPPKFQAGHTLPPLTRWGWSMDLATRKELAGRRGYAVEFADYVSEAVADAALENPTSANGQCLALVAQNPKAYRRTNSRYGRSPAAQSVGPPGSCGKAK